VDLYVDATTGKLVMRGEDYGEAPRRFFGSDTYEYFLGVKAEDKDQLLLQLMLQVFGGNEQTRTAIAEWLDERGIDYELASFHDTP